LRVDLTEEFLLDKTKLLHIKHGIHHTRAFEEELLKILKETEGDTKP